MKECGNSKIHINSNFILSKQQLHTYRIEIPVNTHEKELCVKLVIYKDYTEMHGQQNIKLSDL